ALPEVQQGGRSPSAGTEPGSASMDLPFDSRFVATSWLHRATGVGRIRLQDADSGGTVIRLPKHRRVRVGSYRRSVTVDQVLVELRRSGEPRRVAALKRSGAASPAFGVGL